MRFLLLSLLLSSLASVAVATPVASADPVLKSHILAPDFTQARAWRLLPGTPPEQLAWRIVTAGHGRGDKHALRLSYAVPTPGDAGLAPDRGLQLDLKGLDASAYDHLELWIKGDAVTGFHPELEVQFRRPAPGHPGMRQVGAYRVGALSPHWQRVRIPLNALAGLDDWHELSAFALALATPPLQPQRGAYLIDGVRLIKTGHPGPAITDRLAPRRKVAWERALGGEMAARPKLKARLAGWPSVFLADPNTLPRDDRAFLRRLAADTWRGLDALTDRVHGLPLDRVEFQSGSLHAETTYIGDYTNITNIGLHVLAVTAAFELKLISRPRALERLSKTLLTLESLETYRGFFYNYYNTTTLERTSHFISFVDSAWLTAGLIVARQTFPELAARGSRLIDRGHYGFFFDERQGLMSHGYYVHMGQRSPYQYGALYTEARLGSLLAIGKGDVPREHWFRMARALSPENSWQTGRPISRLRRSAGGYTWLAGHYRWQGEDFVPSWGGSLFEALMPLLVLDEIAHAPDSLGRNDQVHTRLHRRYALEDLGYPVWGMSPSSTPGNKAYSEYGVRPLGLAGYPSGVVTPHAAALALLTEPDEAARNLRRLAEAFPVYGDFGFYDAVNPLTGQVATHYLCLNQAMILVALANHLADHAVQRHFASDPIVQRILPLLGIEHFVD